MEPPRTRRGCRGSGSSKTAHFKNFKSLSAEARQEREDDRRRKLNEQFASTLQDKINAMKFRFLSKASLVQEIALSTDTVFNKNFECEPPLLQDEDIVDFSQMRNLVTEIREKHNSKKDDDLTEDRFYIDLQKEIVAIETEARTIVLKKGGEHPDYVSVQQADTDIEVTPSIEKRIEFVKTQKFTRNITGQVLLPYPVRLRKDPLEWKQAFYDLLAFSVITDILIEVGDLGHIRMDPKIKEGLDDIKIRGHKEMILRDNPVVDILYKGELYLLYPVFTGYSDTGSYMCGSPRQSLASQRSVFCKVETRKIENMTFHHNVFVGVRMYEKLKERRILVFHEACKYWRHRWKNKKPAQRCSSMTGKDTG